MKRGQAVLSYCRTFLFVFFGVLLSLGTAVSMNKTLAKEVCKQIEAFAGSKIVQLPLLQKPWNSEEDRAGDDGVCTWVTCQRSGQRKCNKVFERPCTNTNLSVNSGKSSRRSRLEGRDAVTERLKCHKSENPFEKCYVVVDTPMAWEDAIEECYDRNLDLVSPDSKEEWEELVKYLLENPGIYWTSGNCKGQYQWEWESQCAPFSYDFSKWGPAASSTINKERECVSMNISTDLSSSGWDPRDCTEKYKFVCKLQSLECRNLPPPPTESPDTDSSRKRKLALKKSTQSGIIKPNRVTRGTRDDLTGCYKISPILHPPVTWDEARLACVGDSLGDLTTIVSDAELDILIKAVKDQREAFTSNNNLTLPIVETFWIGGFFRGRFFGLYWRPTCDATTFTKWQWEPDEADTGNGQTCALFTWTCDGYSKKKAMGMRMGRCDEKRRYICKQKTKNCRQ